MCLYMFFFFLLVLLLSNLYSSPTCAATDLFFSLKFITCLLFIIVCWSVICGHVASKEDLIPPVPILTRYKKEAGIKAFVKKEIYDPRLPDERRSTEINVLTTPTLCIQLNTLYVSSSLTLSLSSNNNIWIIAKSFMDLELWVPNLLCHIALLFSKSIRGFTSCPI